MRIRSQRWAPVVSAVMVAAWLVCAAGGWATAAQAQGHGKGKSRAAAAASSASSASAAASVSAASAPGSGSLLAAEAAPVPQAAASGTLAEAAPVAQRVTLSQVLQGALDNFDVAASRAALDAVRADVLAADHAPLPVLSAKAGAIDGQNGIGAGNALSDKRIDKSVGIDWTWERGNKRERRVAAAQAFVNAAQADVQDTRVQQQILALNAFFDLLGAQQRQTEVRAMFDSARLLSEVMRRRLKAGDVAAQEVSRAEIELTKSRLDQDAAALELARSSLTLAQLLGRPHETLRADDEPWPKVDAKTWAARPEQQITQALSQRPDVQAAEGRVLASQAALEAAQAQRKSDITWGVSVDHYPSVSTRLLELRMQMPLQWGYQQQGEIGRAAAQIQLAQQQAARTRSLAQADLNRLWQEARAAALVQRTHDEDLLPRARQVLAQAELAYSKGALSLTDLLDARRTLRASLLDALAARSAYAKALGAWQLRMAS